MDIHALKWFFISFVFMCGLYSLTALADNTTDPCAGAPHYPRQLVTFRPSGEGTMNILFWAEKMVTEQKHLIALLDQSHIDDKQILLNKLTAFCSDIQINEITASPNLVEVEEKIRQEKLRLLEAMYLCGIAIEQAIHTEVTYCKNAVNNNIAQDNGLRLNRFLQEIPNKRSLIIDHKHDPDTPLSSLTHKELEDIVGSKNVTSLSQVAFKKSYFSLIELGSVLMPEYNASGQNEGFTEANFYGVIGLDNRWQYKPDSSLTRWRLTHWIPSRMALHTGINVAFYSSPIGDCKDEEDNTLGSEEPLPTECDQPDKSISSLKFKDISNTVNASVYFNPMFRPDKSAPWELGFILHYGMNSKEKLDGKLDSISDYRLIGAKLALNEFLALKKYKNGLPRFTIEALKASFEDFAGSGLRSDRTVVYANYRVFEEYPVKVGLLVNDGSGPDIIALTLSYGFTPSDILDVLDF